MRSSHFLALAAASTALAQRPSNTSICDYYSTLLLGTSNATTQVKLLTLLVNTAVIGNYTQPNHLAVPGILAPNATFNGTKVNLIPYFNGDLMSTNVGTKQGVSVNWLDDGGASALEKSKPADSMASHQYLLLTKLYSYFGVLLGCSDIGKYGFPAYTGDTSMYNVHKYMALDAYEVQYFIEQVGLAAASFGVSTDDVTWVGTTLQNVFGMKCAAKTNVLPTWPKELQSVCIADYCPEAPNATCKAYGKVVNPAPNSTESTAPTTTGNGTAKASPTSKGGAGALGFSWISMFVMACGAIMFAF